MSRKQEVIRSRIWEEVPEQDDPFAAAVCYCAGYDVYGELLGKASWAEYLYLLFTQERPTREQARLLEGLALALANPGPRDHSVRAAMNGGVGGSTYAACLMAALGVGAGKLGGAREVALAMDFWQECGTDLASWQQRLKSAEVADEASVWPNMEHPPGFNPHGSSCATPVRQTLAYLEQCAPGGMLSWLQARRASLETAAKCPLAMSGVAAAAFVDLGLESRQGEMLYLLLRLPGAAAHALEQEDYGWRKYPLFRDALVLEDDPDAPADDEARSKKSRTRS